MLNPWSLVLIALAYTAVLFVIAWIGDGKRITRDHRRVRAVIYSLSLAVYCTSWTFYGAVGNAATTGWGFLPIYLGPILMMLLGADVLRRIALQAQHQRITSIADYIAFRYGRSHSIAVLITVAAVIGSVPYIALQLKGITTGFEVISEASGTGDALPGNLSLYIALALALFSTLFGTRNLDASEHHRGLMWAIALESLVKLLAFLSVGLFVTFGLFDGPGDLFGRAARVPELRQLMLIEGIPGGYANWLALSFLSMMAIMFLPRQFQVAVVENVNADHLRKARCGQRRITLLGRVGQRAWVLQPVEDRLGDHTVLLVECTQRLGLTPPGGKPADGAGQRGPAVVFGSLQEIVQPLSRRRILDIFNRLADECRVGLDDLLIAIGYRHHVPSCSSARPV